MQRVQLLQHHRIRRVLEVGAGGKIAFAVILNDLLKRAGPESLYQTVDLKEDTGAAAKEAGIEYELTKVTDINEIMKFNIMMTPALAVDGEVKAAGRIPHTDEIKKMIS